MIVQLGKCGTMRGCSPVEYMGLFGLSWSEKVAKNMISRLYGTEYEDNLKSFWGAGGMNTTLVKNLQNVYTELLVKGYTLPNFTYDIPDQYANIMAEAIAKSTATPQPVTLAFLGALYELTANGTIDYKLFNPLGYKETVETIEQAEPKTGISQVVETTGKTLNKVLIVGGLAVGAYLLANVNKIFKR